MKKIKQSIFLLAIGTLMAFTNSSNSEKITDNTFVIKNNDLQVINAAIKHPNGKTHFFVGKHFHVYNTTTGKLEKMGLIGKDGWYKLPGNVDAALLHPINKKAYIFKGNQYYRYDFTKKKVDKIGIVGSDGFKGLYGPFDATITHSTNNKAYFFKGNKYYSYNFKTKKVAAKYIGKNAWKGVPVSIDAIVMHKNGRAYAFKNDHYYRYIFGKQVDKKAVIGRDGWKLFHQLDAAVYNDLGDNLNTTGVHFIRGRYGYYEGNESGGGILLGSPTVGFAPHNVITKKRFGIDWYKGVPPNVDAGIYHPVEKKFYFFKVEKYYRYDPISKKIDASGVIGKDAWPGIPINLDAAYFFDEEVFFFRGTKVFVFDIETNKRIFYGEISTKFKGIPNFIDASMRNGIYIGSIFFLKKDRAYIYTPSTGKLDVKKIPSDLFK